MIFRENELQAYRVGRFSIDLPHGDLTQRGDVARPAVLSGPGCLRQGSDGSLVLTLYGSRAEPKATGSVGAKPGSWLEDRELYDFVGRDLTGRTWTAERLHVASQGESTSKAIVCTAHVREFHCKREYSRELPNVLWAWFPGEFRLPVNEYTITKRTVAGHSNEGFDLNVWTFPLGDRSVLVSRHEDAVELEIASGPSIPSAFHTRIQEALWLVLARRVEPSIVFVQNGRHAHGRLIPLRRPVGIPRLQPPLDLHDTKYADSAGKLVAAYVQATTSHEADEKYYHPLGVSLSRILTASQIDIETEALVLSTVLEGLADECFPHLGIPNAELQKAVAVAIRAATTGLVIGEHRDRIVNSLSLIKARNGRSALGDLQSRNVITAEQLAAWNRVRHRIAHGKSRKHPARKFAEMCNIIHTAFYRILFQLIGYSGPLRDFGRLGWPTLAYQPVDIEQT